MRNEYAINNTGLGITASLAIYCLVMTISGFHLVYTALSAPPHSQESVATSANALKEFIDSSPQGLVISILYSVCFSSSLVYYTLAIASRSVTASRRSLPFLSALIAPAIVLFSCIVYLRLLRNLYCMAALLMCTLNAAYASIVASHKKKPYLQVFLPWNVVPEATEHRKSRLLFRRV